MARITMVEVTQTVTQLIMLWMLAMVGPLASAAEDTHQQDVAAAMTAFNAAWPEDTMESDPQFGTERILQWLDLNHRGLEEVKRHALVRDFDNADRALLEYYRKTWGERAKVIKELNPDDRRHAQDALVHFFKGNGRYPNIYRGGKIDWTSPAQHEGAEIGDHEWLLQYHRLTWWTSLGNAFAFTGDARYFDEWRFELVSYTRDLLPLQVNKPAYLSRGMECAARCERMRDAIPYMIKSPKFDVKLLKYAIYFMASHAEHLPKVIAKNGNHKLYGLKSCFLNGVTFPELAGSSEWIKMALDGIPPMIDADIYDDGMNRELVFSYHVMYLDIFLDCWNMFESNGYGDKVTNSYKEKMKKMAEIYAMQSFPDFTLCQFGDAWKHRDTSFIFKKEKFNKITYGFPYKKFMATKGEEGEAPTVTNVAYPESGFYFFRSHWGKDAVFMPIKCADVGEWHNQIDNGTFELYAFGRNLMNDSGCYVYGSSLVDEQRWRKWFRSSRAHQTMTLDGRDITLSRKHLMWSNQDNLSLVSFENTSYSDLTHRRTVMFVDKKYFVIHDEAIGPAEGKVGIHFQFVPSPWELNGLYAKTMFNDGANLLVKTIPCGKDLDAIKDEGWISFANGSKEERPAWTWSINKTSEDRKVDFMTVLVPMREGEEIPESKVRLSHTEQQSARIYSLSIGEKTYTINADIEKSVCEMTQSQP